SSSCELCCPMNKLSFFLLEDSIVCPICLEVFTDPATTACGHNFCMDCLQDYWDHQAMIGESPYCPQCREPFRSRPQLRKNISLGEIAVRFAQEENWRTKTLPVAGPKDVPCDFCSPQKLKSVKSCLQCVASLCKDHIRSHYEDKAFKSHQLLEPISNLQAKLCSKHHKLQELFCKTDGRLICCSCVREEHKNHEAIPLKEEKARKVVEVTRVQANVENQIMMMASDSQKQQGRVTYLSKVVKNARDEVNRSFAEVVKEIKHLQAKVMEFVDQEERLALVELGNSIQQRQGWLTNLKKQNLWLANLLREPSEQQFLQEFPQTKAMGGCAEAIVGLMCEESSSFVGLKQSLSDLKTQLAMVGLCFINKIFKHGITMLPYEVIPAVAHRKNFLKYYCNLNFNGNMASEELFLFKETHSVLNIGILLENNSAPGKGFNHWPQVLCSRSLCEGCHYWETEVSNTWFCLGVTYNYAYNVGKGYICYLIGRNNTSWCLEWDSVKFSVWHNNTQTVVKGKHYKTVGVFLDYSAGSLTFYGVTNTMNLIYRFLTTYTEPLYPAVMVSSGGLVTLNQHTG
uniref:Uncharacterized protein n=1 Tax=Sphenodon punctatus TaxID=8508 RepID=A0A8D0GUW1_SPHPU